jgi:predicted RNase H-like HicB family nuclease
MARSFTLEYWQDEGWFVGRLKEVPGVFSQGETLEELKVNILDAYNLMIEEERKVLSAVVKSRIKAIQVEV